MIKELKIQSPSTASNRKKYKQKNDSTKTGSVDYTSTKWSTTDKQFENSPITVESTFYNTLRCKNYEKDDVVLENLKYFVNNSDSVRKIEKVDCTPKVVFTSKDYLKDKNAILNSIYHDNNFKNSQMKKNGKTISQISFYNFDSELCLDDNVKRMEDVVTELKTSVFDKIARMICDKSRLKEELEQSNNILEHRLKISQERLNNYKKFNYNTTNDTTKFEYHNERVLRENSHMEMEIPLTKKRIDDMKHEIYEKDAESKNLKYQIYRFESEVAFLQEENRRVGKNVVDLQNEKKNIMAALVIMKKQTDSLKERVLKEDNKSKGFINEVSTLLHRGKVLNK